MPAHGAAAVSVTFEPPGLVTEECVLEVRVAEFGAAPVRCTVVGSVAPGLAKERALRAAVMPHEPLTAPGGGVLPRLTMEQLDGSSLVKVGAGLVVFSPFRCEGMGAVWCEGGACVSTRHGMCSRCGLGAWSLV